MHVPHRAVRAGVAGQGRDLQRLMRMIHGHAEAAAHGRRVIEWKRRAVTRGQDERRIAGGKRGAQPVVGRRRVGDESSPMSNS